MESEYHYESETPKEVGEQPSPAAPTLSTHGQMNMYAPLPPEPTETPSASTVDDQPPTPPELAETTPAPTPTDQTPTSSELAETTPVSTAADQATPPPEPTETTPAPTTTDQTPTPPELTETTPVSAITDQTPTPSDMAETTPASAATDQTLTATDLTETTPAPTTTDQTPISPVSETPITSGEDIQTPSLQIVDTHKQPDEIPLPRPDNPETKEVSDGKEIGLGRDDGQAAAASATVDNPAAAVSQVEPIDHTVMSSDVTNLPPTDGPTLPPISPSLPAAPSNLASSNDLIVFKTDYPTEDLGGAANEINAENADINKANRELFEARADAKRIEAETGLSIDEYRKQAAFRLAHPELYDSSNPQEILNSSVPVRPPLPTAADTIVSPASISTHSGGTFVVPSNMPLSTVDTTSLPPVNPQLFSKTTNATDAVLLTQIEQPSKKPAEFRNEAAQYSLTSEEYLEYKNRSNLDAEGTPELLPNPISLSQPTENIVENQSLATVYPILTSNAGDVQITRIQKELEPDDLRKALHKTIEGANDIKDLGSKDARRNLYQKISIGELAEQLCYASTGSQNLNELVNNFPWADGTTTTELQQVKSHVNTSIQDATSSYANDLTNALGVGKDTKIDAAVEKLWELRSAENWDKVSANLPPEVANAADPESMKAAMLDKIVLRIPAEDVPRVQEYVREQAIKNPAKYGLISVSKQEIERLAERIKPITLNIDNHQLRMIARDVFQTKMENAGYPKGVPYRKHLS